jgi:hypothetical protein
LQPRPSNIPPVATRLSAVMEPRPGLERFLPPPAAAGPQPRGEHDAGRDFRDGGARVPRTGLARRRRLRTALAGAFILVLVGAATVTATNALRSGRPPSFQSPDPRQAATPATPARKRVTKRNEARRRDKPQTYRHADRRRAKARRVRVEVAIVASDPPLTESAQPSQQVRSARQRHRRPKRVEKRREKIREKKPVPLPAPPGLPLFHCFSAKRKDHYMTADQSSVGQMEESRADYDCTVVGYVYDTEVKGTKAIPLDDGTSVYVFSSSEVRTEPDCPKHALYVHRGGIDRWYNTTESDEGVAGYVCK